MAYRSRESKILVACRVVYGQTNRTYQEYDLQVNYGDEGKSSSSPAICELNGRLYVFWKASVGGQMGTIIFTSTEDGGSWEDLQRTPFQTLAAPAAVRYKNRLYLAYLTKSSEIMISSSPDSRTWSAATSQRFGIGATTNATSPYPPTFGACKDALTMFWGGGSRESDAVLYADVETNGIDNPTTSNNASSMTPKKIDEGKWQTKIGNTTAYRSNNQYVVTTNRNGEISIATNDEFEKRANLTEQATSKSAATCGACLLPGFFGRTYMEEWALVLVYRGLGQDSKLYEISIGRTKARYEILIESLQTQVSDLEVQKTQAIKEAKENKDAKDALQLRLTLVEGQRDQALKDARAEKVLRQSQEEDLRRELQKAEQSRNALQTQFDGLQIKEENRIKELQGTIDELRRQPQQPPSSLPPGAYGISVQYRAGGDPLTLTDKEGFQGAYWTDSPGAQKLIIGGSGTSGMVRFQLSNGEQIAVALGVHNFSRWCDIDTAVKPNETNATRLLRYYQASDPKFAMLWKQAPSLKATTHRGKTITVDFIVAIGHELQAVIGCF
jgi:Fungal fruit body lectin